MLSEKEKVALDKNITAVPESLEIEPETRKNAFGESVEFYQDDTGAPIYDTDIIYHLSIETETCTKIFFVLFERAQELLDEFEVELVTAKLSKHSDGKTFKKEKKVALKEMEEMFNE
ncbi:hypothetical protein SAMN04487821_101286 [Enterococcus malodoratus]|uniref:hypothetical protein n=1 Tax=Enterococcus malodoratus TaxID=71451 RepID=UPI0008D58272|nr:hypothetical protein [Enterococcus malodoratus]SES68054.1 hypothetical protein SAMN04487821_101286 [Enterococcus malodoratus]